MRGLRLKHLTTLCLLCAVMLQISAATAATPDGTALTASGEGSAGYVPHATTRYLYDESLSPSCQNITNYSSTTLELYVPALNQTEWSNFLSLPPSGITLSECTYPTASGTGGNQDTGGGSWNDSGMCSCNGGTDGDAGSPGYDSDNDSSSPW